MNAHVDTARPVRSRRRWWGLVALAALPASLGLVAILPGQVPHQGPAQPVLPTGGAPGTTIDRLPVAHTAAFPTAQASNSPPVQGSLPLEEPPDDRNATAAFSLPVVPSLTVASSTQHAEVPRHWGAPRGAVSTQGLGTSVDLIGPLGRPLGELLKVEFTVQPKPSKDMHDHYVLVHSVNGVRLPQPKEVPAKMFSSFDDRELTPGNRGLFFAFQDGGMIGVPDQVMALWGPMQTTGYHFATWLTIVKPAE
jgi:hypothetical protein